MFIAVISLQDI